MELATILESFNLPAEAVSDLSKQGYKLVSLADGVAGTMSGHDQGMGFKFVTEQVRNDVKSEAMGYEVSDTIEMIQWTVDRKNKPMERVSQLPTELLKFNKLGEVSGGRYAEAYKRFKSGQSADGLHLSRWKDCSDSDRFSLEGSGIYTVEQLAEIPRVRVHDLFGGNFDLLWEKAVAYVKAKEGTANNEALMDKIAELQKQVAALTAKSNTVTESEDSDIAEVMALAEQKTTKGKKK